QSSRPGAPAGRAPLVRLASAVEPEWLIDLPAERLAGRRGARFDAAAERGGGGSRPPYHGPGLGGSRRDDGTGPEVEGALAEAALAAGPAAFADRDALDAWRARLGFARSIDATLPEAGDAAVREALVALCAGRRSFAELREADLLESVRARLEPD